MRWLFPYSLASAFFVILIVASALSSPTVQVANPSQADWAWLNENFHNILDHSLPLKKDAGVLVSYRSYETLQVGDSEYYLSILEQPGTYKANLAAHVRVPEGKPIGGQLLAFHHGSPKSSVAEAEENLKFQDWDLTEKQCPALRTTVQELTKVRFGITYSETIFVDPRVHEFHLDSSSTSADLTIVDFEHPLVQWASDARRSIQACGADNLPSTKSVGSTKK
jgi:hypothetical protein